MPSGPRVVADLPKVWARGRCWRHRRRVDQTRITESTSRATNGCPPVSTAYDVGCTWKHSIGARRARSRAAEGDHQVTRPYGGRTVLAPRLIEFATGASRRDPAKERESCRSVVWRGSDERGT
jgi:hypothetical protein